MAKMPASLIGHGNPDSASTNRKGSDQRPLTTAADERCRKHQEELLDEALEETFPASDPPSIARSHPETTESGAESERKGKANDSLQDRTPRPRPQRGQDESA